MARIIVPGKSAHPDFALPRRQPQGLVVKNEQYSPSHLWVFTPAHGHVREGIKDLVGDAAAKWGGTGTQPGMYFSPRPRVGMGLSYSDSGTGNIGSKALYCGGSDGAGSPAQGAFTQFSIIWFGAITTAANYSLYEGLTTGSVGFRLTATGELNFTEPFVADHYTTSGAGVSTNTPTALGITYDGATVRMFVDGRSVGSSNITASFSSAGQWGIFSYLFGENGAQTFLCATFPHALSFGAAQDLTRNPYQLLRPANEPIFFIPSAGGGGVTGSLAATESGSDTAALAGDVLVKGALSATETGSDTAALTGDVLVRGALAATETGTDAAALTGDVLVKGALAVTETGSDAAAFTGTTAIFGSLAATETGSDAAALTGKVRVTGALAATETGAEAAAFTGDVLVQGALAVTETGADTASFVGNTSAAPTLTAATVVSITATTATPRVTLSFAA